MPICDTFKDIKNRLSADVVYVPSKGDILTFNHHRSQWEPPSPASNQPTPLVGQVLPLVNADLQSAGPPFQVSSGVWEFPQPSFLSNNNSPSYISGSYNHVPPTSHVYGRGNNTSYQAPDSGYSSMRVKAPHPTLKKYQTYTTHREAAYPTLEEHQAPPRVRRFLE